MNHLFCFYLFIRCVSFSSSKAKGFLFKRFQICPVVVVVAVAIVFRNIVVFFFHALGYGALVFNKAGGAAEFLDAKDDCLYCCLSRPPPGVSKGKFSFSFFFFSVDCRSTNRISRILYCFAVGVGFLGLQSFNIGFPHRILQHAFALRYAAQDAAVEARREARFAKVAAAAKLRFLWVGDRDEILVDAIENSQKIVGERQVLDRHVLAVQRYINHGPNPGRGQIPIIRIPFRKEKFPLFYPPPPPPVGFLSSMQDANFKPFTSSFAMLSQPPRLKSVSPYPLIKLKIRRRSKSNWSRVGWGGSGINKELKNIIRWTWQLTHEIPNNIGFGSLRAVRHGGL